MVSNCERQRHLGGTHEGPHAFQVQHSKLEAHRFPENIRDDDLSEILPLLPDSLEHVDLSKTELSTLGVAKVASRLVNLVHLACPHDVTLVADIPTLLPLLPYVEIVSTEVGHDE